jgi:hypothetical protein
MIQIVPKDRWKAAFKTPMGLYHTVRRTPTVHCAPYVSQSYLRSHQILCALHKSIIPAISSDRLGSFDPRTGCSYMGYLARAVYDTRLFLWGTWSGPVDREGGEGLVMKARVERRGGTEERKGGGWGLSLAHYKLDHTILVNILLCE